MRCGDLERYLEAFVDGRLGRSRTAILRRHLALCAGCQGRVERLRQFERDTQRRFSPAEQPDSIWEGLELDLVGSNGAVGAGRLLASPRLPPAGPSGEAALPRPGARRVAGHPLVAARARGRGAASRLAGALLVAMALGATYQVMRGELGAGRGERTAEQAYLDYRRNRSAPTLSSGEVRQVADWLSAELGRPVVVPPVPDGYRLVGASRAELAGTLSGALIYTEVADPEAAPVMLFVSDAAEGATGPVELAVGENGDGLHQVRWLADQLSYTAVGPVTSDRLLQFHH